MSSLPRISVEQSVLVNILFFVCLLGGLVAFSRIPVEFFPDVNLNEATITTVWTGASAEEIERLVTQKLEEELLSVVDIDKMHSVSQSDVSTIMIDFDEYLGEVAYEAALNDVRAALDRARDLPADAEEPWLTEIKFSEMAPAVMVAVVDTGGDDEAAAGEEDTEGKPFVPKPEELAELAGDYYSEELDVTYALRVEGQGLALESGLAPVMYQSSGIIFAPVEADAVKYRFLTLRFQRDSAGRVSGFELDAGRVTNLSFTRLP